MTTPRTTNHAAPPHDAAARRLVGCVTVAVLGTVLVALRAFVPSTDAPIVEAADERPARISLDEPSHPGDAPVPSPAPVGVNGGDYNPFPIPPELMGIDLSKQTPEEAHAKSAGCLSCHENAHDPHLSRAFHLGCVDCHGGDPTTAVKKKAHVQPRHAGAWPTSANPVRSYTLLNTECPEFVRFVNPGDLRIAHLSCGTVNCHGTETLQVKKSMMTHGCMLWGAALYNNGSVPFKRPQYGESYSMHGTPQRLQTIPPPTEYEMEYKGVLPFLDPLPRFNISQPGNVLRIFERGGRGVIETGIPDIFEDPGKPRVKLGNRGLGTNNRTDPVFIGLAKTRLFDPTLNFLGTNDHPGDYRSSGCTSCHMMYANDRSPVSAGPYGKYGNRGLAAARTDSFVKAVDPMIPKNESGHPIAHRFTRAVPSSQCIVCHIHPGTTVMNSYLGYMWWDEETDGELMYPAKEKRLTSEQVIEASMANPDEAAARGNWSDPEFVASVAELNPQLRHTQFADFHGHGWVFRAVFKKNREGIPLDHKGDPIPEPTPQQRQASVMMPEYTRQLYRDRDWGNEDAETLAKVRQMEAELERLKDGVPVHLMDIHIEKGMHCVDCHFVQDVHGDTKLYGEVRAAIEITCTDCHGDIDRAAFRRGEKGGIQMRTSGPAAAERGNPELNGRNLALMRTPFGKQRFEVRGGRVVQNSMVERNMSWEVPQVRDTINPDHPRYNARSALAKTIRWEGNGTAWGDLPDDASQCAHSGTKMSCIACHSSWNPSCYGCHLPQKANKKLPDLHNEGDITRNHVSYNFQTLRDDVFMLARDGLVTGNRIGPSRSSCAVHVGSYNGNRESIYVQQQTISGEGLSGIAFSTNVPHTVRGKQETKNCTDCHLSRENDNNAVMAQLLMHGTNYLNFMGRYCWVGAGEHGLHAVVVTERDEPQAVIGSSLHATAYPDRYRKHVDLRRELELGHEHPGNDIGDNVFRPFKGTDIRSLQLRGEFLYAACGEAGVRIYDVAFIDHKGFSERIVTAPVSPVGQRLYVRTPCATSVAAPTTTAPDPTRTHRPENHEAKVHSMYAYIYATDAIEGLILINVGTLLDGNPLNNFVERSLTFNPQGMLKGARNVTIAGTYAYVCCDLGIVVVSIEDPTKPVVTCVIGQDQVRHPKAFQVQFRYGFAVDADGLKVFDVTDLATPKLVSNLDIPDARNVYVARTYAYVAGGCNGLVIVDVKNPEQPRVDQVFNALGEINDLNDVKLGITYVSEFAYLADGKNGLRVVQLTSPETLGNDGFSPRPTPKLIATQKIPKGGHAYAVSEAVDRDRAVDETGNQLSVFGRIGARPLSLDDQRRMYLGPDGAVYSVIDGVRDFGLPAGKRREWNLHHQLEKFYGPSRATQSK